MMNGRRAGFTLIEVVTVLAVLAVVSTLGGGVFFRMTSAWTDMRAHAELDARIDQVFAQIRRDVNEIHVPAIVGFPPLEGTARDAEGDEVRLPVQASGGQTGLVMYQVEAVAGAARLVRTTGALSPDRPDANPMTIAEGALGFAVEFAPRDGGPWVRGWNHAELPAAMRVSIALADPARPGPQAARAAGFPVRVEGWAAR